MSIDFLPITVIAAIVIFLSKETLEYIRNRRMKLKKLLVFKRMIAEEVEINTAVLSSLYSALTTICDDTANIERTPRILKTPSGGIRIEFEAHPICFGTGWPLLPLSRTVFDRLYLELAELDPSFFETTARVYSAVAEIKHVRDSLIDHIENNNQTPDGFLASFSEWAQGVLEESRGSLATLYFECTGKTLERGKLRSFT